MSTTALVPYIDWFGFCPECRHFKEIDQETSLDIASVICFDCSGVFWRGYYHAVTNQPGPNPWDVYRNEAWK